MTTTPQDNQRPSPTVDLTMMDAFHAALRRDLKRLARAASGADLAQPDKALVVRAGWEVFSAQLRLHHTHEDNFLWPRLRTRLDGRQDSLAVLEAMEDEHTGVAAAVERVEVFVSCPADSSGREVSDAADTLIDELSAHLAHEERDALPLVGHVMTQQEWASFVAEQRRSMGLRGAAKLFPWLLDAKEEGDRQRILQTLPPPLRVVYTRIWAPRYARQHLWETKTAPANSAQRVR